MLVEIPYDLYKRIEKEKGVNVAIPFNVCLREEIEHVLNSLEVFDEEQRKRYAKAAFKEFEEYSELTEDLYFFISDLIDEE